MSGPKHLWSGDWQHESAAVSEERVGRRVKPQPAEPKSDPTATPAPNPRPRRRFVVVRSRIGLRDALPVLLAVLLLGAAGAYGLSTIGSSGPRASTAAGTTSASPGATAGGSSTPPAAAPPAAVAGATTQGPASRPVRWLGMQIQTLPPGVAVIETVGAGSEGQVAGLQPGDVILALNHQPINAATDIGAAIRRLRAGDVVELEISNGSTLYQVQATLAAPPSLQP
jgi:membrane-associated protease RseP (regulator of RpoE activity)